MEWPHKIPGGIGGLKSSRCVCSVTDCPPPQQAHCSVGSGGCAVSALSKPHSGILSGGKRCPSCLRRDGGKPGGEQVPGLQI